MVDDDAEQLVVDEHQAFNGQLVGMVQPAAMAEPLGRAQGVDQAMECRCQRLDAGHDSPDDGRPRRRGLAGNRRAIRTPDHVTCSSG